jgi:hypothetical protein
VAGLGGAVAGLCAPAVIGDTGKVPYESTLGRAGRQPGRRQGTGMMYLYSMEHAHILWHERGVYIWNHESRYAYILP